MKKAVFIDKDGVIVEDTGFVHRIEDFKLITNAIEGLKLLKDYKLFIITNQSGIGRGIYKVKDFLKFNNHLLKELKKHNARLFHSQSAPQHWPIGCWSRRTASEVQPRIHPALFAPSVPYPL